jgi:hypothetical protein
MLHRITFVAAALVLATGVVAYAASGSSQAKTIKATLFYTGLTTVDADHNEKPSVGDYAIAPGFFVGAGGKRLGSVHASCLQMNAAGTEYNCTDVNHFAGGDIITSGRFSPLEKVDREAIVGGTGVYANVRGTLVTRWLAKDFSKAAVTFTLAP